MEKADKTGREEEDVRPEIHTNEKGLVEKELNIMECVAECK